MTDLPQHQDHAAALHRLADLIEADDARCQALYGAPVGIPASYGHDLIRQAVNGDGDAYRAEWIRLVREEAPGAAEKWSAGRQELIHELARLVYPGGAQARAVSAEHVRALAEEMATHPARTRAQQQQEANR